MARKTDARSITLDRLVEAVERKSDIQLFEVSGEFPEDRTIRWAGDSIESFLELSQGLNGRVVYLRKESVEEDDLEMADHLGELWMVEAGFMHNGIFHVFQSIAPWAAEYAEAAEEDEEAGKIREAQKLGRELEERQDELVRGFLQLLNDGSIVIEPSGSELRYRFLEFVRQQLEFPDDTSIYGIERLDPQVAKAVVQAVERVASEIRSRERKLIEGLVPQCAQWARKNSLKTLNLGDVEVFLADENVNLTKESRSFLWRKTNLTLKTGRVPD